MKKLTKTKKIIIAVVAAVLCFATVFVVVTCSSVHPLTRFGIKLLRKQNFQMDIVLSGIPIFGSVAIGCEIDGNVQHIPQGTFISESYVETVDGKQYVYSKDESGAWRKTESEIGEDGLFSAIQDNELLQKLVDPDNYESVEGKKNVFRQKEGVEFENCKDIVITLEKDSCTIEMILYTSGMALDALIVISNIGKINLTLPQVD